MRISVVLSRLLLSDTRYDTAFEIILISQLTLCVLLPLFCYVVTFVFVLFFLRHLLDVL